MKRGSEFIIGAGASCSFGYPTGLQLKKDIIDKMKNVRNYSNEDDWFAYL